MISNNNNFVLKNSKLSDWVMFKFPETQNYTIDKLDEIFNDQKEFTEQIYNKFNDKNFECYNFDKETFDLYYTIQRAITELTEALKEIDDHTKIWKNDKTPYTKDKVFTELVDSSKFIHQAIQMLGYHAKDYYEMHKEKTKINTERQKNNY